MKTGDLVSVTWPDGTMGLSSNDMSEHRDLPRGAMGIVLMKHGSWLIRVLFPPGVALDVVENHIDLV